MALNDPPYYRDSSGPSMSPLSWLIGGTVPMGNCGGVRVRMHAWVLLVAIVLPALMLSTIGGRSAGLLAFSILGMSVIHEFGHWVVARSFGVIRHEMRVSPMGGPVNPERLEPPRVAAWIALGGPIANFVACSGAGGLLWVLAPSSMPWNPLAAGVLHKSAGLNFGELALWWLFLVSYTLLLLNLLPIHPLDGGHVLHAAFRPRYGFSNTLACTCLISLMGVVAITVAGVVLMHPQLMVVGAVCAFACYLEFRSIDRLQSNEADDVEFATAYDTPVIPRRRKIDRGAIRRARQAAMELRVEQQRLDTILAKVSKLGLARLTWKERRILKKATERRRRVDL